VVNEIMSVQEVFGYLTDLIASGDVLPEGFALDVRVPPGYGPPGDLIVGVRAAHPGGGVAFSATVIKPPHTADTVDATVADQIAKVRRVLRAKMN
jgi:hypothetical protein